MENKITSLFNFKDACIDLCNVIAITRSALVIPFEGIEASDDSTTTSETYNHMITNYNINIFIKGYQTPIIICYAIKEERDNDYDLVINGLREVSCKLHLGC